MRHHRAKIALLLAAGLLGSCTTESGEDGANDSFGGAGKADGGLSQAEVAGVLALVNEASYDLLKNDVSVTARVAKNITEHRAAGDGQLDTSDDDRFDNLAELDAVPYVGPVALDLLLAYAKANGYVQGGGGGQFCKQQHAGKTPSGADVQICDELYDSPPYVHLPGDASSGDSVTSYGGLLRGNGVALVGADGKQRTLSTAQPAGLVAVETLFAVYEVAGTTSGDTLQTSAVKPVLWIPGAVQDKVLLGSWEGLAAGRTASTVFGEYFDENMPVRIRFTLSTAMNYPSPWSHSPGTDGLIVAGKVDNMTQSVAAADGTCIPSLSSLGGKSPFYMASDDHITLWRHPNMHGVNDSVIVMDYPSGADHLSINGMGNIGAFSPVGLVAEAGPDYTVTTIYPHATPSGHAVWDLHKVTSGGGACQ